MVGNFPTVPSCVATSPCRPVALTGLVEACALEPAELAAIFGFEPLSPRRRRSGREAAWRAARSARLAELLELVRAMLGGDARAWLRTGNAALGHRTPLSLLIDDPDALPRLCRLLRDEAAS